DEVTEVLESVMRGTAPVAVVQKSVSWPVRDVLHCAATVVGAGPKYTDILERLGAAIGEVGP
ncbi:hypothetical protein ADL07_04885, partial [Streptomyces sp. NRRL F-4707]|uniref:hypothetical protein n=1 Tax=Streptomyces sp. NRRL F-4707 TaxID=1519496 RepID=UPI0006C0CBB7